MIRSNDCKPIRTRAPTSSSSKPNNEKGDPAVVNAAKRPVNVIMGRKGGTPLSLAYLSNLGVKRISVGSTLARTALRSLVRAAREMKEKGTFSFATDAVDPKDMNTIFPEQD